MAVFRVSVTTHDNERSSQQALRFAPFPYHGRKTLNQMVEFFRRSYILNHMVSNQAAVLDRVFHAPAHPARRRMLRALAGRERNLSELAAPFRMSFPAAPKHVRVLERARLVRRRVSGRQRLCSLQADSLKEVVQWTEQFRQHWEQRFQALDELLDRMKRNECP